MAQLYTLVLTVLGAGSIIVASVSAANIIAKPSASCSIFCLYKSCRYGFDPLQPCPRQGCLPCYDPCKKTVCPVGMQQLVVTSTNVTTGNIVSTDCACVCIPFRPVSCPSGQTIVTTTDLNGCRSCYCRSIAVPVDDIRVWSPN